MKPKLIEKIKATETGNRAYSNSNFIEVSHTLKTPDTFNNPIMAKEYRVGVQLGTYVYIDEDEYQAIGINQATKQVGHMICKEVYGEIREELINLRYDLYNALGFQSRNIIEKLDNIIEMTQYD